MNAIFRMYIGIIKISLCSSESSCIFRTFAFLFIFNLSAIVLLVSNAELK